MNAVPGVALGPVGLMELLAQRRSQAFQDALAAAARKGPSSRQRDAVEAVRAAVEAAQGKGRNVNVRA